VLVVGANIATDPQGGATADQITTPGNSATSSISQAYTHATAGYWAFSVWAKMASGTGTVSLRIDSNTETGTPASFNLTTAWQRIGVVQNLTVTPITTKTVYIITGTTTGIAFWGACLDNNNGIRGYYPVATSKVTATIRTMISRQPFTCLGILTGVNAVNSNAGMTAAAGAVTSTRAAIGTTSTDGLVATNTTDSTSGVPVQMSPRVHWHGEVWDTGGAGSNKTHDWIAEVLPVSGNPTTSSLQFWHSLHGAAYGVMAQLDNSGNLSVAGEVLAGEIKTFMFPIPGTLVVGTNVLGASMPVPWACTIVKARAHVDTAPTGASVVFDINKNGTTIGTTKLTITAGNNFATPVTTFDVTTLGIEDLLTCDVDQIGSIIAGAKGWVELTVRKTGTY
jgi:hypothetical protein